MNILVKAFWVLGVDRTVQNVVGAESYGFYFSLLSFSILFNILLDFGITNYNNRRVASDPSGLRDVLGNIFVIRLVFAILYSGVTIFIAHLLGYGKERMLLLSVLIINQFLASFILYLRSNITALQFFTIDSFLSVTDRLLMIIFCSALLWGGVTDIKFRIEWFVYCQTAAYSLTFIISLVAVMLKGRISAINFDILKVKRIIRDSAPFALLSLFMSVYWRIDSVMIERMVDEGAIHTGIYAQAFRLLDAGAMIPFLFSLILLPMFSKIISSGQSPSSLLRFAAILLIIPASVVATISLIYPYEIMDFLYVSHAEESSSVYRILMAGYVPVSVVYIFGTLLTSLGKLRQLNLVALGGMVMNIVLNTVLIPLYGPVGAASASIITQSALAVTFYILAVREGKIIGGARLFVQILIYIFVISITGYLIYNQGVSLVINLAAVSLVALILPLVLRFIRWNEIISFFGRESK